MHSLPFGGGQKLHWQFPQIVLGKVDYGFFAGKVNE
jgi:hypothetical protein